MEATVTAVWAFVPAFAWLYFVYRKDRFEPEPFKQILKVYLAGILATVPAYFGNKYGAYLFPDASRVFGDTAGYVLLIVGPNEELWKFLAVYLVMYRHGEFDEPMDGLIYACTAGLGFAGLENVIYALQMGPSVVLLRSISAVPAHFLDAAIYGYVLGLRKFGHRTIAIPLAVIVAGLVHGLYDLFALGSKFVGLWALLGLIAVVACQAFWFRRAVTRLLDLSPFRLGGAGIACTHCQGLTPGDSAFCNHCGVSLATTIPD
ncbi:MAG: PrsW family intramembrane metalloprotease [Myxococcales bacterium]|nr:PrsW family intramembrane metalloprotease [Myxococcales bacterium]